MLHSPYSLFLANLQEMAASLKQRRRNINSITQVTAGTAKMYFVSLLHQRNYEGKLMFDHTDKKLEIQVRWQSPKIKGLSCDGEWFHFCIQKFRVVPPTEKKFEKILQSLIRKQNSDSPSNRDVAGLFRAS